jgi:hypothetical protein
MTKHTQEEIDAAIEDKRLMLDHPNRYINLHKHTILAALEAYKQPQASNEEALVSLEVMRSDLVTLAIQAKVNINHVTTKANKNAGTIRQALTAPQTVDVESLKKPESDRYPTTKNEKHLDKEPWDDITCIYEARRIMKMLEDDDG